MLKYKALRFLTLALRALQDALHNLKVAAEVAAENRGDAAKDAACAAMRRAEDKAHGLYLAARQRHEAMIERMLDDEDMLAYQLQDVCEANVDLRRRIMNEVL